MPEHEEHCLHSLKRYGVRGDEIHAWIDEPSQIAGGSHRNFRHDLASLPTAIQLFGKSYGDDMVENIFLDHLKADSEENRKQETHESLKLKLWSGSEDTFLWQNFLKLSDDQLEASLQIKSKAEIRKRREYLGLIRPRFIKRTKNQPRIQRIVFKLLRRQKIFFTVNITGSHDNVDFGVFNSQGSVSKLIPQNIERIPRTKSFSHDIIVSGNYCFYFSNSFSLISSKDIEFLYHLENGKENRLSFRI